MEVDHEPSIDPYAPQESPGHLGSEDGCRVLGSPVLLRGVRSEGQPPRQCTPGALNQKGDRVCYLGYNCHKLLEGYYGVPGIGAILVPVNIRLTAQDFDYILNECTPRVLFVNGDFVAQIEQIRENLPFVEHFVLMDEAESTPPWITARYEELLEKRSPQPPYPSGGLSLR